MVQTDQKIKCKNAIKEKDNSKVYITETHFSWSITVGYLEMFQGKIVGEQYRNKVFLLKK